MNKISTKTPKKYIKGSAKLVTFQDGGELINLDLHFDSLADLPTSPGGYVKLTLRRKSEVDQYGNMYSITENDFVPNKDAKSSGPIKGVIKTTSGNPFEL